MKITAMPISTTMGMIITTTKILMIIITITAMTTVTIMKAATTTATATATVMTVMKMIIVTATKKNLRGITSQYFISPEFVILMRIRSDLFTEYCII